MLWQVSHYKQNRLFFAGGVRLDDVSYSHGVRQTLMLLFKNTTGSSTYLHPSIYPLSSEFFPPSSLITRLHAMSEPHRQQRKGRRCVAGFKLVDTGKQGGYEEYMADFGRSLFCLASTGAGWGVRLKLALMHGCIPLVIADRVQVTFNPAT